MCSNGSFFSPLKHVKVQRKRPHQLCVWYTQLKQNSDEALTLVCQVRNKTHHFDDLLRLLHSLDVKVAVRSFLHLLPQLLIGLGHLGEESLQPVQD